MIIEFIVFILSLSALIIGAELLVSGSERLALRFGISPFIIGASLIAIGTSLPEMAASIAASLKNSSTLAIANVVGSNIFNIIAILGISFIVLKKSEIKRDFFQKDSAWLLFPLFTFLVIIYDGKISRVEGFILIALMVSYIMFLVNNNEKVEIEKDEFSGIKVFLSILIGFIFLIKGADYTISSAIKLANSLGVSKWIIGVFLIALGTSLPELIVSVAAARRGNLELILGNIIGSNIANITMVIGASAIVREIEVRINLFDIIFLIISSFSLVFITANKIYNRSSGLYLLILLIIFVMNETK